MKTLNYQGNSTAPSSCEYTLTQLGDKTAIIFLQPGSVGAPPTSMIESLTMRVLVRDLRGTPPDQVRVFEYHDPALHPAEVWREVKFMKAGRIADHKGTVQMLVETLMLPEATLEEFFVDDPVWSSVSDADIQVLSRALSGEKAIAGVEDNQED